MPQVIGEDYRFTVADIADDPRRMIVYGESAEDAGSYYFLDFATGNNLGIASNYPDIPTAWIDRKSVV